jgi:peptide/nickel transport system permease protein
MIWFFARRVLGFVASVLVAGVLIDLILRVSPASGSITRPGFLPAQILTGDLGASVSAQAPVGVLVAGALGVTVPLALIAAILALGIGGGIAWLAARHPGQIVDRGLIALAELGIATPNFWLGLVLLLLFATTLHWLPAGGFMQWRENFGGALASLVLPAIALALPKAAVIARLGRTALVDKHNSDVLRAARARGLTRRDAVRQVGLRNIAPSLLRPLSIELAGLVAGTLIVENVFYLPGLGTLIVNAIASDDLGLVRGGVMTLVLLLGGTLFLTRLADIWADPRLRDGRWP